MAAKQLCTHGSIEIGGDQSMQLVIVSCFYEIIHVKSFALCRNAQDSRKQTGT